jgi:hypothetical protein
MVCSTISASEMLKSLSLGEGNRDTDTIYTTQALALIKNTRFFLLPPECQNRIAYFLAFDDRETDEEFVERASKLKEIPEELKKKVLDSKSSGHTHFRYGSAFLGLLSYSVDGQKLYRFREEFSRSVQLPHGNTLGKSHIIKSFDISTLHSEDLSAKFEKMFNFFLNIKCFAISHDEKQSAQLIKHHNDDYSVKEYLIDCRKIGEEKPYQTFVIPEKYKPFISIGFNKQSTKLIMFTREVLGPPIGESTSPVPDPIKHTLFSLVSESKHEKSCEKTLVGYFAWLIGKYGNQ